jgi:hypothetical protein
LGRTSVQLKSIAKGNPKARLRMPSLAQSQAAALVVAVDLLFSSRREQLVALAAPYKIPAVYEDRRFVAAGVRLLRHQSSKTANYWRNIGELW